jgi:hypothetical protein
MKHAILAAATLFAASVTSVCAQTVDRSLFNEQPSGGVMSQDMSVPTGGLQGSTTGLAWMNGPYGNGLHTREPTNHQMARGQVVAPDGPQVSRMAANTGQ